ncbi:MAG: rhodanese-like domain-containing protein [Bacteroidales bacterium]
MDIFFANTGFEGGGMLNVTPRQAVELCRKGAVLIDVREEYMNRFKRACVPEIIYCPFTILEENYLQLPLGKPMILADCSGIHSKEAVKFFSEKGLGDMVANLAGGMVEWERDEMPLIIDSSEQLSGS